MLARIVKERRTEKNFLSFIVTSISVCSVFRMNAY